MRIAFKEWAVICRALAKGRQSLIVRKGGITETGGSFQVNYDQFLLMPTFLHQSEKSLVPESQDLLAEIMADAPPVGTITFRHFVKVIDTLTLYSVHDLAQFRRLHVWSDHVIEERFHRWRDEIQLMHVQVFALPQPVNIPFHDSYAGCKSWVELADDVPTVGAVAVDLLPSVST